MPPMDTYDTDTGWGDQGGGTTNTNGNKDE